MQSPTKAPSLTLPRTSAGEGTKSAVASARPHRLRAALTSAGLCLFFLVVYGACNTFTATRDDVGVWVYAWERHIPFVPLMIVPYMSIDLFFVGAPFLCRDSRQLRVLAGRIVLAICVAAIFFLLMPLRFSFERPVTGGALGAVFDWFRSMDLPYNQFPSLHIALRTILGDVYARRSSGAWRVAVNVWFSLISASTLLVYQHHLIDVVGGFALGAVCLYAVSEAPWRAAVTRRGRLAGYYGAAALVLTAAALLKTPWTLWLLWPAASLGVVAGAYLGLGPGVFRKHAGRVPAGARLVMAWPLLGQWLSWKHYARRSRPWDAIGDQVLLGRALSVAEAHAARAAGVTAVLDVTGEFSSAFSCLNDCAYLNVPVLDLTAPTRQQIEQSVAFIERQARGGVVYVHCKAGYSRSAVMVAAYLIRSGAARDAEEAISILRAARPGIVIRPEAAAAIQAYAADAQRAAPAATI
jgi:hypothetical protein